MKKWVFLCWSVQSMKKWFFLKKSGFFYVLSRFGVHGAPAPAPARCLRLLHLWERCAPHQCHDSRRELAKWAIHFDADEHGVADASFNGTWSSLSPVLLTTSFLSYQGLEVDGVNLLTPPTYSAESQEAYQRFSSVRIIVEQVIGKIKDWAAARETLRLPTTNTADLLDFHHWVWTVVAVFVNLFCTVHT